MSGLRQRHPIFSVSVAICLALLASMLIVAQAWSAPTQQTRQNLLTNPGFEGDFHIQCSFPGGRPWMTLPCGGALDTVPWQTVQVADGWHAWWQIPASDRKSPDYYKYPNYCGRSAPDDCVAWHNPEYRDTRNAPQEPPRIRSGENSQKYFTFWSVHEGGVYQTVSGVRPGSLLRFSIYMEAWSATKMDAGEPNPHFSFGQSSMHLRIGIDPTGGNDPWSKEIVWSSEQDAYDQFTRFEVEAVARSSKVTVFTHSRPEYPMEHNDVYLDDAELAIIGGGPGAPISINPPPVVVAVGALSTTQSNPGGRITHIVRTGDTLFAIALQYGVPVDQIMQLNGLSAESRLDIGRELLIALPPPPIAGPAPITAIGGTGSGQGRICLKIYNDLDHDGVRSSADAALNLTGGQIVLLDANANLIVDRMLDGSVDQVCFDQLPATVYRITAQVPAGYLATGVQSWAVSLNSDAAVDVAFGAQLDPSSGAAPIGLIMAALGLLIVIALGIFVWRRRQQREMIGSNW
jgi:LysM repeat protein